MNIANKRILITGINGFIGSHLAKKLKNLNADVYGIALEPSPDKKIFQASITDRKTISKIIAKHKIQSCIHLASISLVEKGQNSPYETLDTNINGTLNILEEARTNNFEKVIIASTTHVYGDTKPPYSEKHVPRPSRPYETSKVCADLVAQTYANSFDMPVLIPRFVNVYGPDDRNDQRLIPKTIRSIIKDKEVTLWGKNERDFIYIDDVVNAYIKLLKYDMNKVNKNRIFNIGTGVVHNVEDVIMKLVDISGKEVRVKKIKTDRKSEIRSQYVSVKKAKKLLGWSSKVDLEDGLKKTYKWYEKKYI